MNLGRATVVCGAALLIAAGCSGRTETGLPGGEQARTETASPETKPVSLGELPMTFEQNVGQSEPSTRFVARGAGYGVFVTPRGIAIALKQTTAEPANTLDVDRDLVPVGVRVLRLEWIGANPAPAIRGDERVPTSVNYLVGNDPSAWRSDVPSFRKVRYAELYPGIDVSVYGTGRDLEYDFVVAKGADPSVIAFAYEGGDGVTVRGDGSLEVRVDGRVLVQKAPFAYQVGERGERTEVPTRYVQRGAALGIQVADYDRSRELVIDPQLAYASYLGGTGSDFANTIAVDGSGAVYVAGSTVSANFPVSSAYQGTYAGAGASGFGDAFVTKLTSAMTSVTWSTYVGGSGDDSFARIRVDGSNRVIAAGFSSSSNYPTASAIQGTYGGGTFDGVVTVLNAAGNGLVASTYFGGSNDDRFRDVALDGSGNILLTGLSRSTNFPTTSAHQAARSGGGDAVVVKLSPLAASTVYSTYLGGSSATLTEFGNGIATDSAGNAYVVGYTPSNDFPRVSASQNTFGGGAQDAFVSKLGPTGTLLVSTFLGGADNDAAAAVAVAPGGTSVWVVGSTGSANFPTASAAQAGWRGNEDAFATRMSTAALAIQVSTYLGGSGLDRARSVAVDSSGQAIIGGVTSSTNFPTASATQSASGGGGKSDGFVTRLNTLGSSIDFSTYFGGNDDEEITGVASSGTAIVFSGWTRSANMPTAGGPQQAANAGAPDGFVGRYASTQTATVTTDLLTYATGQTVTVTYSGMAGAATDWIAIAAEGSANSAYVAYKYTNGGTSGTMTFPNLAPGRYVARAYFNWSATRSFAIQGQSAVFTIGGTTSATVTTNSASYAAGQTVTVTYSGMSGASTDWIAIAASGSAATSYVAYAYTGGGASGTRNFANLPAGTYVARAFFNWSSGGYTVRGESAPFTIGATGTTLTTASTTYTVGSTVTVNFAGFPGNQTDWIALARAGQANNQYVSSVYTNGLTSGSRNFTITQAGTYVFRAYFNWSSGGFTVRAESAPITVTAPAVTLTTNKTTYAAGESITVTYSGFPGNATDWVSLARSGSANDQYVSAIYTNGATSGSMTFAGLQSGTYVARAYFNWPSGGYTVYGTSATFTVP